MNNKKLLKKIIEVSNIINRKNRKGNSNFIIISPEFSKILEKYKNKKERLKKLKKLNSCFIF